MTFSNKIPLLSDRPGKGVNAGRAMQIPLLSNPGDGLNSWGGAI